MSEVTCKTHESTPAEERCQSCMEPICQGCIVHYDLDTLCPDCARSRKTRSRYLRIGGAVAAAAAVGVLAYFAFPLFLDFLEKQRKAAPFDYGQFADEVESLESQLEKEPCDRSKIVKLTKAYYKAGDYRSTIDRADAFIEECGKHDRLLWTTYEAHKKLSEWDKAVEDASTLIRRDRYDKDFWWWRGFAYEQKGELEKAARDYRQSLSLVPELRSIPFNLANVYEKLDRPCDAIFPLERFLHYHPDVDNRRQVRRRIADLYSQCDAVGREGRATIQLDTTGGTMRTTVSVNGGPPGTFVVDTGATYTSVSPSYAEELGLSASDGESILLSTANGVKKGTLLTADSVDVHGVEAPRVDVAIVDDLPEDVDGLLGLSFLSRYEMAIDQGEGTLTLESRSARPASDPN